MIGSAIGAGLSIAGGIAGGISQAKAMKKVINNIKEQQADNKDWYNRRYNEDATQRADAQAAVRNMEALITKRNAQVAGRAAVMGGTEESVAATKEANAKAMAQVASNIVVNGEQRKDSIESTYRANDAALQDRLNDMEIQKANNTAQAIQGVAQTGANIASVV